MKTAKARWVGISLLFPLAQVLWSAEPTAKVVFNAADYGALPNDGRDDTAALQRLFAAAARQPESIVRLAPGRYEVSTNISSGLASPIFRIQNAHGLTIEGESTILAASGIASLFYFENSTDINVNNLTVDWVTRPAVGARVIKIDDDEVIFKQETPGPITDGLPLQGVYLYDEEARRPAPNRDECYWIDGVKGPLIRPVEAGVFALPLRGYSTPLEGLVLKIGDCAVIRFVIYGSDALTFNACSKVEISNVTILAAPGMGIVGLGSMDIELRHVTVKPASGQWISTCADATHFTNCRGIVTLQDCEFEAMGDDALNIHSDLLRIKTVDSTNMIIVERGKNPKLAITTLPVPGDQMAFAPKLHPLEFAPGAEVVHTGLLPPQPFCRIELSSILPEWGR